MSLQREDLEQYVYAKKTLGITEEKVFDRISEVIRVIHKSFGIHLDNLVGWTWYFYDAIEGEVGTLRVDASEPDTVLDFEALDAEIEYVFEWWGNNDNEDRDVLSVREYDYATSFPAAFLTMSDDEIVDFIKRTKEL